MNNVQTGSDIAECLLKGEIERLSDDLDRLHRERDSFQQQCSVMAEENARLEQDSKRLKFLISEGVLNNDFEGNFYVFVNRHGKFKTFDGGDDAFKAIDDAMRYCDANK